MERSTLYISGGKEMNKLVAKMNDAAFYAYILYMGLKLMSMIVGIAAEKKAKG